MFHFLVCFDSFACKVNIFIGNNEQFYKIILIFAAGTNKPINFKTMAYTETTTTGYGTRVGNSFKAIGSGILLFIAGTALLWWNEGRAVKTEKMLDEAAGAYVEMDNPNKKDASLEGELICGTAMATTEDSLVDAQFGIGAKAISINRRVEYYQWVEHEQSKSEDKLGGKQVTTTTYTYTKEWTSRPVESAQFKDPAYQNKNMVLTTIEDAEQYAENVSFGAYKLNESLIHSIRSSEGMELAIAEGGYAKRLPADVLIREQEALKATIQEMDIVFCSALIPGKVAPIIITEEMVKGMKKGAVIVDISIDQGGNCELTPKGGIEKKYGVTLMGVKNIPGLLPTSSTWMFSNNMYNLVKYLVKDGAVVLDREDEIIQKSLVCIDGNLVHQGAREAMGL